MAAPLLHTLLTVTFSLIHALSPMPHPAAKKYTRVPMPRGQRPATPIPKMVHNLQLIPDGFDQFNFNSLYDGDNDDIDESAKSDNSLDQFIVSTFRLWMLLAIMLGGMLVFMIVACCFMKVRIPRTKREIELTKTKRRTRKTTLGLFSSSAGGSSSYHSATTSVGSNKNGVQMIRRSSTTNDFDNDDDVNWRYEEKQPKIIMQTHHPDVRKELEEREKPRTSRMYPSSSRQPLIEPSDRSPPGRLKQPIMEHRERSPRDTGKSPRPSNDKSPKPASSPRSSKPRPHQQLPYVTAKQLKPSSATTAV